MLVKAWSADSFLRHQETPTDAADTCHYPSSGIVIKYHLCGKAAASGSKVGMVTSSMQLSAEQDIKEEPSVSSLGMSRRVKACEGKGE